MLMLVAGPVWAAKKVDLDYHVKLLPGSDQAQVSLTLAQGSAVRSFDFDLGNQGVYSDFKADGEWQAQSGRGIWHPASGKASLTYRVRISHAHGSALTSQSKAINYDTRMTAKWALMRGEDLVPRARLDQQDGVELVSRLEFELPVGWKSVETPWPRIGKNRFRIDNVSRLFDRPTGWMLAGTLGSRRTRLGDTEVTVTAPQGQGLHRMDVLTLLTFVWPQMQAVFARNPQKLLVVAAADQMAHGAVSANDSIYLNSNRPVVSETGASPLLRELVHVFNRLSSSHHSEWISEGIAEYYAIEVMRRAGGMSDERYQNVQLGLAKASANVTTLRGDRIDTATAARAVLLLRELDEEIRQQTHNEKSLDDVCRALMRLNTVSTKIFIQLSESVIGEPSKVLASKLLQ
ncbi:MULTISPECIES: hypothetical protein [unclassified Pseudomonas]|uniref:hypothetical protein n=1 Tax=unclassified Pseudomonas TaxID=196821 RepID=UPI002B22AB4F|nr:MULTISPECIES: hypothetical protein [unclassified Pseudomonas]MEA9976966.1 hypothetical protein [Pseudomonas sp. RTS4]MEB0198388.1 hypothetical protein [Pseudomonas sp. 5S4]MEB0247467.1 hypothetical protein [Pseudomonas sp. 10S5]